MEISELVETIQQQSMDKGLFRMDFLSLTLNDAVPGLYYDHFYGDKLTPEEARAELNTYLENSKWYSVRYEAAVLLDDKQKQESILNNAIGKEGWSDMGQLHLNFKVIPSTSKKERKEWKKDLKHFYNRHPEKEWRMRAGKALGYSRPRLWLHERPLLKITACLTLAGGSIMAITDYISS